MSLSDRRVQIGSYLGIKPITHGQIHTFQIAIPNAETIEILPERREILAQTLKEHQSNLASLVVRRIEADDDEKEYEIVYGADWCIVAKELEIECLWVWVFDLTDEQAITMKTELEQLLGGGSIPPITSEATRQEHPPLELQLKQQMRELMKDINTKFQALSQTISSENTQINHRLQQLENTVNNLTDNLAKLITKLKYDAMTLVEVKEIAKQRNIKGRSKMNKNQLIIAILSQD
ncbi:MAG TPA: Rho termination factor N-terminal domain-containing protein [Candidatus Obscuribacterales bacterium]